MFADFLHLALLLSPCVTLALGMAVSEDILEVAGVLSGDCTLPCTATSTAGVQYRAVRWYKVTQQESSRLSGLLSKELPNGTTRWYSSVERQVELLGDSRDIFLPNLTCGDSGMYRCHLAAPVGQQNRDGQILLTVTDCPVTPTEDLLTDANLVIFAIAVLMLALVIFLISYVCLKNTLKDKRKTTTRTETLLDAPLQPLSKKDLMLIYTLGPKTATMKHVCV